MSEEGAEARLKAHCRVMIEDSIGYARAFLADSQVRRDFEDALGTISERFHRACEGETQAQRAERLAEIPRLLERHGLAREEGP